MGATRRKPPLIMLPGTDVTSMPAARQTQTRLATSIDRRRYAKVAELIHTRSKLSR
jgi:hypothetical protein